MTTHAVETADETSWWDSASCAEADPEAWYPDKGGSTRQAKQVCRSCVVRAECLEFAIKTGEAFGVWGGMSERERRKLRRTTDQEVAA